jgi:hypothetical protein
LVNRSKSRKTVSVMDFRSHIAENPDRRVYDPEHWEMAFLRMPIEAAVSVDMKSLK